MSDADIRFAGSIPDIYDRYLGPVLFEPYAADLSRRIAGHSGNTVLEVACGTGILTQALRVHLPSAVHIVATDLNQPMIDYAQAKLGDIENIEWKQADFSALPFPSASFDCIACQFGLMFLPDKQVALKEARRVLSNGGLLAFNVWDDLAHNVFSQKAHETLAQFFPNDPPKFFTIPYGFNDPDVINRLLTSCGFDQVQIEFVTLEARSSSARGLATGLLAGTPASNAIQERGGSVEAVVVALTESLKQIGGDDPFRSTMKALVVTARAAA